MPQQATTLDPVSATDGRARPQARRVATMADAVIGSEILKIAAEIRALREAGTDVCNLTVGDFDPAEFRIPRALEEGIEAALRRGETNYPPSNGVQPLRDAVRAFYERTLGLHFAPDSVLITSGSRPGIYGTYRTLVDPGDRVVYPVPSWNNNHYCHLVGAVGVPVACHADAAFLPTRALLEPVVRGARLLAINSPLNPAGTAFTAEQLGEICDLVLEENERRAAVGERPFFLMYDQVYWTLTFGETRHVDPISLRPEMARYTVYVDGISKALAATGVRVGWVVGPTDVIKPMSNLLGHVGAWAPRAEQVATAQFLGQAQALREYHGALIGGLQERLQALYAGVQALRVEGFPVDAIEPMGAIYLSVRFALAGRQTPDGRTLRTNEEIRRYLLEQAGLAAVPFQAFGSVEESGWFRLSVGAVSPAEIARVLPRLRGALARLATA
jgi:aspartate aminotransferase